MIHELPADRIASAIRLFVLELLIGGPNQSHKVSFKELPRFQGKDVQQDILADPGQYLFQTFSKKVRLIVAAILLKDRYPRFPLGTPAPKRSASFPVEGRSERQTAECWSILILKIFVSPAFASQAVQHSPKLVFQGTSKRLPQGRPDRRECGQWKSPPTDQAVFRKKPPSIQNARIVSGLRETYFRFLRSNATMYQTVGYTSASFLRWPWFVARPVDVLWFEQTGFHAPPRGCPPRGRSVLSRRKTRPVADRRLP